MHSLSISLLYTTARPHLIDQVISRWLTPGMEGVEMIVVTDDPFNSSVVRPDLHFVVNSGRRDCVTGWNLAAQHAKGDILVQVSDDLFPPNGWNTYILDIVTSMSHTRKDIVLNLLDERQQKNAIYHPVLTRAAYEKLHCMYPSDFESMCCDHWFYAFHKKHSYCAFSNEVFWHHRHRTTHQVEVDDVMRVHESPERYARGRQTFQKYIKEHEL
jgi:hypothetical protein